MIAAKMVRRQDRLQAGGRAAERDPARCGYPRVFHERDLRGVGTHDLVRDAAGG
jgi:hypothetical protein